MQPSETEIRQYTITADRNRTFLAAIIDEGTCRAITLYYLENQEEKSTKLVVTDDEKAITFAKILAMEKVLIEVAFIRTEYSKPGVMECNLSLSSLIVSVKKRHKNLKSVLYVKKKVNILPTEMIVLCILRKLCFSVVPVSMFVANVQTRVGIRLLDVAEVRIIAIRRLVKLKNKIFVFFQ